jgi:hypothetical protein
MSYNYGALSEYGAPLPTKEEDRIVFEYVPDPSKDMFQVGRVATNDFIVKGPLHYDNSMVTCGPVSRYACRIELERRAPFRAFVYAAGFNATKVQNVQCCSLPSPGGHITCCLELKRTVSKVGRISYSIFASLNRIFPLVFLPQNGSTRMPPLRTGGAPSTPSPPMGSSCGGLSCESGVRYLCRAMFSDPGPCLTRLESASVRPSPTSSQTAPSLTFVVSSSYFKIQSLWPNSFVST